MNRISRELINIAREINATDYGDFTRLTIGFDKGTKQQRYDILQIAVDKVKSRIGAADLAFQFINGLLEANCLSDDQLYIVKDILNMFDGQFLYNLIVNIYISAFFCYFLFF